MRTPQSNGLIHAASNLNLMTYNLEIKGAGAVREYSLKIDQFIKNHHLIYGIAIRNSERYGKAVSGNFLVEDKVLMESFLNIQNQSAQNQFINVPLQLIFFATVENGYWPLGGIAMKMDGSKIMTHATVSADRSFELIIYYYDPNICE